MIYSQKAQLVLQVMAKTVKQLQVIDHDDRDTHQTLMTQWIYESRWWQDNNTTHLMMPNGYRHTDLNEKNTYFV
jgi:hypothetical protein